MVKSSIRGLFKKKLIELSNTYRKPRITFRIQVPPELVWWYYQEYGTATRGEPGKASGVPYDIKPLIAKSLKIPAGDGSFNFVKEVKDHPGIPARYSVKQILPELEEYCKEQLLAVSLLHNNISLEKVAKECAEHAILLIAESLDRNLNTSPDGKLDGKSPGSVFSELAKVVRED